MSEQRVFLGWMWFDRNGKRVEVGDRVRPTQWGHTTNISQWMMSRQAKVVELKQTRVVIAFPAGDMCEPTFRYVTVNPRYLEVLCPEEVPPL